MERHPSIKPRPNTRLSSTLACGSPDLRNTRSLFKINRAIKPRPVGISGSVQVLIADFLKTEEIFLLDGSIRSPLPLLKGVRNCNDPWGRQG